MREAVGRGAQMLSDLSSTAIKKDAGHSNRSQLFTANLFNYVSMSGGTPPLAARFAPRMSRGMNNPDPTHEACWTEENQHETRGSGDTDVPINDVIIIIIEGSGIDFPRLRGKSSSLNDTRGARRGSVAIAQRRRVSVGDEGLLGSGLI